MTTTLHDMITDLAGFTLDAAASAPVDIRQMSVRLPIEFGLRHSAAGYILAADTPEEIQARDLSTPVGLFDFTLEIERGGSDD